MRNFQDTFEHVSDHYQRYFNLHDRTFKKGNQTIPRRNENIFIHFKDYNYKIIFKISQVGRCNEAD